jgi:hypothetical protein
MLGVSDGLIPTEASAGPKTDPASPPSNDPPLQTGKQPPEYRKPPSNSFTSGFSNCVAKSIAGGRITVLCRNLRRGHRIVCKGTESNRRDRGWCWVWRCCCNDLLLRRARVRL